MARVSRFTVFLWCTLVVYTVLSGYVVATLQNSEYTNPYPTETIIAGKTYQYTESFNLTFNSEHVASTFSPDRKISWQDPLFGVNGFYVARKDTWFGIVWIPLSGSPVSTDYIIENFDTSTNCTVVIFDSGTQFQTDVYFYPLIGSNNTFVYYPMNESIANNAVTVVMGVNSTTYTFFDISMLYGVVTGYNSYGAPTPISVLIGSIWWILFLLALVKLVIG